MSATRIYRMLMPASTRSFHANGVPLTIVASTRLDGVSPRASDKPFSQPARASSMRRDETFERSARAYVVVAMRAARSSNLHA